MVLSTLAWLLPVAAMSWWWLAVFQLSQSLAGLYLALAIAPNHKGMPTWAPGMALSFLERQVLSSRNVAPNRLWDFGDSSRTNATTDVVVHTYAAGNYSVTLVVTGRGGAATDTETNCGGVSPMTLAAFGLRRELSCATWWIPARSVQVRLSLRSSLTDHYSQLSTINHPLSSSLLTDHESPITFSSLQLSTINFPLPTDLNFR